MQQSKATTPTRYESLSEKREQLTLTNLVRAQNQKKFLQAAIASALSPTEGDYKDNAAHASGKITEWLNSVGEKKLAQKVPCGYSNPRAFWAWVEANQ